MLWGALALAGAALTLAAPGGGAAPKLRIAFTCGRPADICVMNADGTRLRQLTHNHATDEDPTWSPDATKIAFDSSRDGQSEIYVMNADGGRARRLTRTRSNEAEPAWSADGQKIAFVGDATGNLEIYVMNADGTGRLDLTRNRAADTDEAWSPNGKGLAFASNRGGQSGIWVMDPQGKQVGRITPGPAITPAWAPDGRKLVVTAPGGLYVIDLVRTAASRLTAGRIDTEPSWSPDGKEIAFRRGGGSSAEIYLIHPDGTGLKRLTHNSTPDLTPAWSRR